MGATPYLSNLILDKILKGKDFQVTPYLSLHSGDPIEGDNELEGASYGRIDVSSKFDFAKDGESANVEAIEFDELPEGKATHAGIWDAPEGGNLLWTSRFRRAVSLDEDQAVRFKVGRARTFIID